MCTCTGNENHASFCTVEGISVLNERISGHLRFPSWPNFTLDCAIRAHPASTGSVVQTEKSKLNRVLHNHRRCSSQARQPVGDGVWLGRAEKTGDNITGTPEGVTTKRLSSGKSALKHQKEHMKSRQQLGDRQVRALIDHEALSDGCSACQGSGTAQSLASRDRCLRCREGENNQARDRTCQRWALRASCKKKKNMEHGEEKRQRCSGDSIEPITEETNHTHTGPLKRCFLWACVLKNESTTNPNIVRL